MFLLDQDEDELKNTTTLLSKDHKAGADFDSSLCNLRKSQDIVSARDKASKLFAGHLDCIINNASCR